MVVEFVKNVCSWMRYIGFGMFRKKRMLLWGWCVGWWWFYFSCLFVVGGIVVLLDIRVSYGVVGISVSLVNRVRWFRLVSWVCWLGGWLLYWCWWLGLCRKVWWLYWWNCECFFLLYVIVVWFVVVIVYWLCVDWVGWWRRIYCYVFWLML